MITIRQVSKSFGRQQALAQVSLTVPEGSLFVLIGPDGAGKTTLFRILVTLLLPKEGQVTVNGINVVKDYRRIRRMTGYMPGTFSLYPDLTVEENLSFYARIFGVTVQENYELIREIYEQIAPFRNRPAGKLSGGMKQKLALSCALIHRPQVLVLDEPTTGVDAASRKEFWEMLKRIRDEGITILVSTAYMDEAARGDRAAFLHEGRLLMSGTPGEIREIYPYPLYACRSEDNFSLLEALRDDPATAVAMLYGKTIHYSPAQADYPVTTLLQRLEESGRYGKIRTEKITPLLEDSFAYLSMQKNETYPSE
jgi:ABC-type multidrug transport system ATPase subunit